MTLIVGARGSMGRRYQAILRYLSRPFQCADIDDLAIDIHKMAERSTGIIIATPTDNHFEMLVGLQELNVPILCEKPLVKDLSQLEYLEREFSGKPLKMVMQYKFLDSEYDGQTIYNYYNHGKDGLYWDCIQLLGLARSTIYLGKDSPMWTCHLNGTQLTLSQMDKAYILMIKEWFKNPNDDFEFLNYMHAKAYEMSLCTSK